MVLFAVLAALTGLISVCVAQPTYYNHSELKWRTFETEHFVFYFHQGEEATVSMAAQIAEEMYDPITSLYDFEPDGKVHFIFQDTDDIANAATYFNDNKIVFWATAMDFELRGTHNWLRNVITHEFTHVIQLGAARKWTRRVPAFYVQVLAYEEEARPDVLYGYPNVLASYAVPGSVIPMWFAEGTAQTQNPSLGHDYWDSKRDMVLRTRTLGGTLLSYDQMGVFDKTSLDAETVYNQGYGLVLYVVKRWGRDALKEISNAARSPLGLNFDGALRKVTGLSGRDLYDEWRQHLEDDYRAKTQTIRDNLVEGREISEDGYVNFSPAFSPDGSKIAYFSNGKRPYWSQTNIIIYTLADSSSEAIPVRATSGMSWSPDGRFLTYARRGMVDMHGSRVNDIYVWDTEREKELKITHGLRLENPCFSPDGLLIACTVNQDGSRNLVVIEVPDLMAKKPERLDKKELEDNPQYQQLTAYHSGVQAFRPKWSPDGDRIIFSVTRDLGRDICVISAEGGPVDTLLDIASEVRDPVFSEDGNTVYYASDQTGIFNVYAMDLNTGESVPLTNVVGSALMPEVPEDLLVFSNCVLNVRHYVEYSGTETDGVFGVYSQLRKCTPSGGLSGCAAIAASIKAL